MRILGWILGALFLADGLSALIGGKRVMTWADQQLSKATPESWHGTLHELSSMDQRVMRVMAINQLVAGTGLLLATAGGVCASRPVESEEECPQPNPQEREVATA